MNTKWESEFDKEFGHETINGAIADYEPLKAFIKDQITKAYNNGYEDGFDRAREIALEAITYKPKTN